MTPRDYLADFVMPNFAEYWRELSDLRRAMNAAMSLHALPARIFYHLEATSTPLPYKDDDDYRNALAAKDADFKLLHEVAKGIKHVSLRKGRPDIDGASSLSVQKRGWGKGAWGVGP